MTQILNAVESLPSCEGATPVCLILIQVMRMLSACPQSLATTFWGMFELTIKESEAKRLTSGSPSTLVPIIPLSRFSLLSQYITVPLMVPLTNVRSEILSNK